jgi:catechol 1,2-dioxygenase
MSNDSYEAEVTAKAAASGNAATEGFLQRTQKANIVADVARTNRIATRLVKALNDVAREENVTYDEYNVFKAWLIKMGTDGEWPLFLDVWLEHTIEENHNADKQGSKGTIEGPYYVPGSPDHAAGSGTIEMRADEPGTPLRFFGQVTSVAGVPLPNAQIELWHADDLGFYSQFAPGLPEWNLRGTFHTDDQGNFEIHTIQPAPYQIPTDGACGDLIAAAGWHAWRPAHLHLKVVADGHHLITTQLYFVGDSHLSDDVAGAVKPELILDPTKLDGGKAEVRYDFVLDPA